MTKSAPSITFNPTSISFGVVDVGASTAKKSYHVRNKAGSYANAVSCSISFLGSQNASEAKTESWVWESTAAGSNQINSLTKYAKAGSVGAAYANSINVKTKVKVPAGASTSGTVLFKHHFKYKYSG